MQVLRWRRLEARETLAAYSKKVVAYKKEKAASQQGLIVEEALKLVASTESNKIVLRYDFGVDGKVAKGMMTSFGKKCKDKGLMLVSADAGSDRVMVVASAPKGGDIDCKAWVNAATEGMGGKGGGKKDSAQCTLSGVSNAEEILKKALS